MMIFIIMMIASYTNYYDPHDFHWDDYVDTFPNSRIVYASPQDEAAEIFVTNGRTNFIW